MEPIALSVTEPRASHPEQASGTVIAAVAEAAASCGANATLNWQLPPTGSTAAQLPGVTANAPILSGTASTAALMPLLVSVTAIGSLVVPAACAAKVTMLGEAVT